LDLHHALEDVVGLDKVRIKKTGDADCRLVTSAQYRGRADDVMQSIVIALENECAYADGWAVASSADRDVIEVRLLTYSDSIGVVTVCILVTPTS
jgi:hypothetical protein